MDKVVLGFSGGVDSSVAALLLADAGYQVHGLYLDTGGGAPEELYPAAERLGFPLTVLDVRAAMEERVCRPFAQGYLRGETPNPCVLCNPAVKFAALCAHADALGAERVATGHYVRAENGRIYKGLPANDQSYMLCRLRREQAERLLAPLGGYEKAGVRALAADRGLPAAKKPDSMEICFIPDGDYAAWIERRGDVPPPGDFIYRGAAVGRHRGIHRYTLGQRRGLAFAAGRRVYVSEICPRSNQVVLSDGDGLYAGGITLRDMSWLVDPPAATFPASVRVRHSRAEYPALVSPRGDGADLELLSPVRAPAAGQSAALYDGPLLLGGGFIC